MPQWHPVFDNKKKPPDYQLEGHFIIFRLHLLAIKPSVFLFRFVFLLLLKNKVSMYRCERVANINEITE